MPYDIPDKPVQHRTVTLEFLNELYGEIASLRKQLDLVTHDKEELEDQVGTLLAQLGPPSTQRRVA